MKKITFFLIVPLLFINCKEKPTYNPFDTQFNLDKSQLLKDGMDTIIDGCGYYRLSFIEKKFSPYYQYFFEKGDNLLAKGFDYRLDTIRSFSSNLDSVQKLSYDLTQLNQELKKFKFRIVRNRDSLLVQNEDSSTSIKANLWTDWVNDSTFVRYITCFISKKS
tara:strand:+ start:46508 stop:46996 length:489 start_codon:yes stop_codon:yes gene_type:complete